MHIANAYAPGSGGIRTTAHALGSGYRRAGHDFTLVVPGDRWRVELLPWGRRVSVPAPRVPGTGGYRVMADLRVIQAVLDRLAPDRLEVSDRLTLRGLGRWACRAGVPSVVFAHERIDGILRAFTPLTGRRAERVADRHNAATADMFDRIVTTSRFGAHEFARIGVPTEHVSLGVDLDQFQPASRSATGGRAPLLVLCSRLSREKRPELAIDALRELQCSGTPARLVIAGSGPLAGRVSRRARGLPVELVGHLEGRPAVAALLGSADVVLAPGPVETFGLAALEALACGTPVVAASTSAVAELVRGDAGRAADPDPAALAAAVRALLAIPERRRRAAARCRAEEYPWSRTSNAMLALHGLPSRAGPAEMHRS